MAARPYDFVIVGGGSAGSALANRLSADPGTRVLVLEAGRPDYIWDPFIHMPAALTFPIGSRFYDWKYESEPEPQLNGRRIYHARGKVLGGSSSINGMIFQRGNPLDYERWAADPGMADWDYAHCLPYFKRMENCLAADSDDPFRGHFGPLVLERGPATSPLFVAFFAAVQQAGYQLTDDVNGYRQEGFNAFDRNIHRGRRLSAARAYLYPVMSRPNLTVATRAFVTKIIFEGTRAVGAEFRHEGKLKRVRSGELILSGGAFNSPRWSPTCRAWARTCRTTWRCTSSTARSCRSRSRPRSSGATAPWSARSGCSGGPGPVPPTTSRAAASPAATTRWSTRT
jgi:choline dehydrogenase